MGASNDEMDIWGDQEDLVPKKSIIRVSDSWFVEKTKLPHDSVAVRKSPSSTFIPSKRDAVSLPLPGQSYNPDYENHQLAIKKVVRNLSKKKRKHESMIKKLTYGKEINPAKLKTENESNKAYHHDLTESSNLLVNFKKLRKSKANQKKSKMADKVKKSPSLLVAKRKKKKLDKISKEVDNIDSIVADLKKEILHREKKSQKRRQVKREGLSIRRFGRHFHTPLTPDVTPSSELVSTLRHLTTGSNHPALERLKSFEERNMIPARMRHSYNQRKEVMPLAPIKIKKEEFRTNSLV